MTPAQRQAGHDKDILTARRRELYQSAREQAETGARVGPTETGPRSAR